VILVAGLSPAWQQIVVLDSLALGEVNRAREVHWCASGKVVNVGLALSCLQVSLPFRSGGSGLPPPITDDGSPASRPLRKGGSGGVPGEGDCKLQNEKCKSQIDGGGSTRTLTMVGGMTGSAIRRELAGLGVSARWIETQAPTRVCTTILDCKSGSTTELVENAGPISQDELTWFTAAYVEEARAADVAVLTGSFPTGVHATFFRDLLENTSGRVVLDAQGEPLLEALEQRPFVVKPNRQELANTLGRRLDSDADLHAAMRELCQRGAHWVVVTQGKDRVWLASESEILSVTPPTIEAVNPIGSGDCLAAGIAVGLARGDDVPEAVRNGVAAAADNARQLLPARLDRARVQALKDAISAE
jgi:tagatose 6-phosphate kinase